MRKVIGIAGITILIIAAIFGLYYFVFTVEPLRGLFILGGTLILIGIIGIAKALYENWFE